MKSPAGAGQSFVRIPELLNDLSVSNFLCRPYRAFYLFSLSFAISSSSNPLGHIVEEALPCFIDGDLAHGKVVDLERVLVDPSQRRVSDTSPTASGVLLPVLDFVRSDYGNICCLLYRERADELSRRMSADSSRPACIRRLRDKAVNGRGGLKQGWRDGRWTVASVGGVRQWWRCAFATERYSAVAGSWAARTSCCLLFVNEPLKSARCRRAIS